jgi:hypothetical protein
LDFCDRRWNLPGILPSKNLKNPQKTLAPKLQYQLIGSGAWFTLNTSLKRLFDPFPFVPNCSK